jgi:hypothetical protein
MSATLTRATAVRGTMLVTVLLGIVAVVAPAPAASASSERPGVKFSTPLCVSGLDVSFNGTVNWKAEPPGSESVAWGDGTSSTSSFPDWHVYATAGTYPITVTATSGGGSGHAATTVTVGPGLATCIYKITPQPVAETGSLAAGATASVVVRVTNAAGHALSAPEPVWLSFAPALGGGSASACCSVSGSTTPEPLGATPLELINGLAPAGGIAVTYTAPATLPDSGSDVIAAAGVPSAGATGSVSTSYQFASSPVPATPPTSIADDCSVDVSKTLGQWLRNLPPNTTVVPPGGACYLVDEGLAVNFPVGLTVDGGTYENLSTQPPPSTGHGTLRGDPVFDVLGGTGVTLENLAIEGANPGGYLAKMAFAAGIDLQGTADATIDNVDITSTFGDGITLNPLRNDADHEGPGILAATDDADISDVTIDGAGRMGMSFVSVGEPAMNGAPPVMGATVSNVQISNVGLDTFDVEADQSTEGAENVTIDGCTSSSTGLGYFFADGGSSAGKRTGNITVENCVMEQMQGPPAVWIDNPGTGASVRGPFTFDDDTFQCGQPSMTATTTPSCVEVTSATATIADSTLDFPVAPPFEDVYAAATDTTLALTDDTVSGYGAVGSSDATSTVSVSGGTWTPAP